MRVVRWYIVQIVEEPVGSGTRRPPSSLMRLASGVWNYYFLSETRGLARVCAEETDHATLEADVRAFPIPRGRLARWADAAPQRIKNELASLGITVDDNDWPDEALDKVGRFFERRASGQWKWDRALFRTVLDGGAEEQA